MRHSIHRWGSIGWRLVVVVLTLALVAAACGDDDAPAATTQATTTTEAGPTTVRVTTLFVCSEAHIGWGVAKGVFASHGLEIELVRTAGGAAGLAAIVADAADISSTNPASAILAVNQGFPIQIISGSFVANPDGQGFAEGVVVAADSDIEGPGDLAGRKVAVNELGSQNHIFTQAWIRAAGVDPSDVNMLALPFPELVPAVLEGRVDAALMTGSQVAQTVGPGTGRFIGNPLTDVIGPVPIATYISTTGFIADNPETVASFVAALTESVAAVNNPANRDEALAVMSDYCSVPVAPLMGVRFPGWSATVDPGVITQIMGVLQGERYIREPLDTSRVLASTALGS